MESMNEISGYLSTQESDSPVEMDVESTNNTTLPPITSSKKPVPTPVTSSQTSKVNLSSYKYIPLRLNEEERTMLNVLMNALEVCEYTDVVDVTFSHTRKSKLSRIIESLVDILSISSGLMISTNLTKGESLISGKSLNENVPFFATLFEIGRRYKIMNPSKMRNVYGKLMYIIMDTQSYHVKNELKLNFVKPIRTVYTFLEEKNSLFILEDSLWVEATKSHHSALQMTKKELALDQQRKAKATEALLTKYTSELLSREEVQRLIDSIADNEAYYDFNVKPVERILTCLTESFDPKNPVDPFSLSLAGGQRSSHKKPNNPFNLYSSYLMSYSNNGACLSHNHSTQFTFVLQTFHLWRSVMSNMPKLWMFADADMLSEEYRLVDTGQGYQRLQQCPRIRKEMTDILSKIQKHFGSWVGLSVVHLGDRDVPNALVFIDKYTQIPRILPPIVQCIEQLPNLVDDTAFHAYVTTEWGSIDGLRMQILSDFFKHGFDGSGDDGGSCIDGRLTSAWNWCSKLHKKPYYYVFMFTGFQGFDGDWKAE